MIKGWRNDPEWVKLDRAVRLERYKRGVEKAQMRMQAEQYELRRQMERDMGVYVHCRDMPAGTIIEVPSDCTPRQKYFWEFWK